VIGASDRRGFDPGDRPVTPEDMCAQITEESLHLRFSGRTDVVGCLAHCYRFVVCFAERQEGCLDDYCPTNFGAG
jgi:hypothetical protein